MNRELWWEKHGYALTRHALDALTRYLGMDPRLIREIGRPQLASELLNDGLKRGGETDYQLVANKRQRRIVGLVSGTYREYRHTEFLRRKKPEGSWTDRRHGPQAYGRRVMGEPRHLEIRSLPPRTVPG